MCKREKRAARSALRAARVLIVVLGAVSVPARAVSARTGGSGGVESEVAQLFESRCARAGCHAGPVAQQGMALTLAEYYASTVDEPSVERPELKRVHPGAPEISYLVMKVKGSPGIVGGRMPLVGNELTEDEIRLIERWIAGIDRVDTRRKGEVKPGPAYPFDGWTVVNLPTTRALDRGSVFFMISHRFNPRIRDGYDAFFGLDGSGIILLTLGYAATDELLVTLGRSNSDDVVEMKARYRLARQDAGTGWPVDISLHGAVDWVTQRPNGGGGRFRNDAFKFAGQVTFARELARGIGFAVVPGILFNAAEGVDDEDPLLTIGLGGRWRFAGNLSLVAEWVPIVDGFVRTRTFGNDIRFDSWGGGLEISTGGHVFQIVISNTVGLTSDQYLRGGDLDIGVPDMRLGFNISRVLNF